MRKPVGPVEIHPQVLKELADEVAKPLSTMFERSRQSGEVPTDLKNITPILKRGGGGGGGNKKKEKKIQELQASLSHLCVWQDHGADPSEGPNKAYRK